MIHESIYQTLFLFYCFVAVVVHFFSLDTMAAYQRYVQVEPIVFVPAIRIVNSEHDERVDATGFSTTQVLINYILSYKGTISLS